MPLPTLSPVLKTSVMSAGKGFVAWLITETSLAAAI